MIPFYQYQNGLMQAGLGNEINFPPHLHKDIELIYVTGGCVEAQVGNSTYEVHKDEICLIFPNQVHSYKTTAENTRHKLLIYRSMFSPELQGRIERKIPVNPVIQDIHEDVITSINRLMDPEEDTMPGLIISAYFQLIWARLTESAPLVERGTGADGLPEKIIGFMTGRFSENISLETLSKQFGISRYKASRIFTETIGVPFCKYLNAMRIDKAKGMLQVNRQDILTVAYECGFESQQTFNRVFKEECGMTPREFRRNFTVTE